MPKEGFTLAEIMIVALLAISIALPNFARNREKTRSVICGEHRSIIEETAKRYLFDIDSLRIE